MKLLFLLALVFCGAVVKNSVVFAGPLYGPLETFLNNLNAQIKQVNQKSDEILQILKPSGKPSKCPKDFIKSKDSCYLFYKTTFMTWTNAANYCATLGAHLLHIETAGEQARIEQLIAADAKLPGNYWHIGGGAYSTTTKTWTWQPGNKPLTYTNWSAGYPKKIPGSCLVFFGPRNNQWITTTCTYRRRFICEI